MSRHPLPQAAHATQIPMRTADLCQRARCLGEARWDVNAALLLAEDAEALASTCRLLRNPGTANRLEGLAESLWVLLDPPRLPDAEALSAVAEQLEILGGAIDQADTSANPAGRSTLFGYAAAEDNGYPLLVRPPPGHSLQFGARTQAPTPVTPLASPAAPADTAPIRPVPVSAAAPPAPLVVAAADAPITPAAAVSSQAAEANVPAESTAPQPEADPGRRVACHLGDDSALSRDIDRALAAQGFEVERPAGVNALLDRLSRSAPAVVVLDGAYQDALESVGAMVKAARARSNQRVTLVALADTGTDLAARLRAMRAGCDAYISQAANAEEVLGRIRELHIAEHADPFRIMIVEDDRSQALFAESILRKNGMQALAVNEAAVVLERLDEFKPDLILMDLNMPVCDGMELTALIREREAYLSTPIVFLSGEGDTEKHFEALNAGGDDFLTKPIAPRHLITAVTSRVRRARQLERRRAPSVRETVRGLQDAAQLARRLTEMLAMEDAATRSGGLMSIELVHAGSLRDRIGRSEFRAVMERLTRIVIERLGHNDVLARSGESGFLLLNPDRPTAALREQAERLRQAVATAAFGSAHAPRALGIAIGICPFVAAVGDAKAMIDAAQRAQQKAASVDAPGVALAEAEDDTSARDNIAEAIRTALSESGFRVVYQPIVSLHGEEEEQFQALLRLTIGDNRVCAASELVPAAEAAGLIAEVDRWMLDNCLHTIAEHLRDGRNLRLFVSLSADSVRDPERVEWMRNALETYRVPAAQISLELRLLDAVQALPEFAAFARAMKQLGVSLTLAGLEAGEQGDALLLELPVDYVKLSPRYSGESDEARRAELRELVKHVHESGRRVIAPRVEEARVAASLWASGIDLIQGNFVQQATRETSYDFQTANS